MEKKVKNEYITNIYTTPGYNSGGTFRSLHVFVIALTRKNCVTYIGPKIDNTDVESWFKGTIYMSRS